MLGYPLALGLLLQLRTRVTLFNVEFLLLGIIIRRSSRTSRSGGSGVHVSARPVIFVRLVPLAIWFTIDQIYSLIQVQSIKSLIPG